MCSATPKAISYGDAEMQLIESGLNAVIHVFRCGNDEKKERLLFCMERYLDPYYGYTLPHTDALFTLLGHEFFAEHNDSLKDEMLTYLECYCDRTLPILRARRDEAAEKWQPRLAQILADETPSS